MSTKQFTPEVVRSATAEVSRLTAVTARQKGEITKAAEDLEKEKKTNERLKETNKKSAERMSKQTLGALGAGAISGIGLQYLNGRHGNAVDGMKIQGKYPVDAVSTFALFGLAALARKQPPLRDGLLGAGIGALTVWGGRHAFQKGALAQLEEAAHTPGATAQLAGAAAAQLGAGGYNATTGTMHVQENAKVGG